MGQRPTCGGRFSAKRKNRGRKNNWQHIWRGLWPPVAWGLWAGENRGLYSLDHGGAVIPPLCGQEQGQE